MNGFVEAQEVLLDETEYFNIQLNRYLVGNYADSTPPFFFTPPLAHKTLAVVKSQYDSLLQASGILPEPYRANIRHGMDSLNATIGNLFIAASELHENTQTPHLQQPRRAAIFASLRRIEFLYETYFQCHTRMQKTLYAAWRTQVGGSILPVLGQAERVFMAFNSPAATLSATLRSATDALAATAKQPLPAFFSPASAVALLNLSATFRDSLLHPTPFDWRNRYFYNHTLRRTANEAGIFSAYNTSATQQIRNGIPTLFAPLLPPRYHLLLPNRTRNADGKILPSIVIWVEWIPSSLPTGLPYKNIILIVII